MSEVIKDESIDETVDEVIVEDTQVEATELEIPEAPLTAARTVSAIKANSICFDVPTCHVQNLPFLYCFQDFGKFFKLPTPWAG